MEAEIANVELLVSAIFALDIERNKKEFLVKCEIAREGIKLSGHTRPYDVSCVCYLEPAIFKYYHFTPNHLEQDGSASIRNVFDKIEEHHTFSLSRSVFFESLRNEAGPIVKLKYDAKELQFWIVGSGGEKGDSSVVKFDVLESEDDLDAHRENAFNQSNDFFIMLVCLKYGCHKIKISDLCCSRNT